MKPAVVGWRLVACGLAAGALPSPAPAEYCAPGLEDTGIVVAGAAGNASDAGCLIEAFLGIYEPSCFQPDEITIQAPPRFRRCDLHEDRKVDHSSFYRDSWCHQGDDDDSEEGIESPTLLFYAGHAHPGHFQALGSKAFFPLDEMVAGDGSLRYLLMCACNLMAHGPETASGANADYPYPWDYPLDCDGGNCEGLENVFGRWHDRLGPNLRLACAASTRICGGGPKVTERFWTEAETGPLSEAFLQAGQPRDYSIPVCMTRGGRDQNALALRDELPETLRTIPEPDDDSDRSYTYIMYPQPVDVSGLQSLVLDLAVPPALMPVLPARTTAVPIGPEGGETLLQDGEYFVSDDGQQRLHRFTGSWSYRGKPVEIRELGETRSVPSAQELFDRAVQTLAQLPGYFPGPHRQVLRDRGSEVEEAPESKATVRDRMDPGLGYVFNVDRSNDKGAHVEPLRHADTVEFVRWLSVPSTPEHDVGLKWVPTFGPGGRLRVQTAPNGDPAAVTLHWHALDFAERDVVWKPVLSLEQALDQARRRLEDPDRYRLSDFRWGYYEDFGHCIQETLSIAYEFDFDPLAEFSAVDHPPRSIVIHAQKADGDRYGPRCLDWD